MSKLGSKLLLLVSFHYFLKCKSERALNKSLTEAPTIWESLIYQVVLTVNIDNSIMFQVD